MLDYIKYESIKKIKMNEAILIAEKYGINITKPTLIEWCLKHKLGHQPGGLGCQWFIFEELFINFISGKAVLDDRKNIVTKKRKNK